MEFLLQLLKGLKISKVALLIILSIIGIILFIAIFAGPFLRECYHDLRHPRMPVVDDE